MQHALYKSEETNIMRVHSQQSFLKIFDSRVVVPKIIESYKTLRTEGNAGQ